MQIASTHGWLSRTLVRNAALVALAAAIASAAGCTGKQMDGTSPSYLIIDELMASTGQEPDVFTGHLRSDVRSDLGAVFADNLQAVIRMALKDPGSQENPNIPSSTNWISVSRYTVRFLRSDGRNTPGVDVPYPFEGGISLLAMPSPDAAVVTLVRAQAKLEPPLSTLAFGNGSIATIAEITFYGTDGAGREVSVTGRINVEFANWADPE